MLLKEGIHPLERTAVTDGDALDLRLPEQELHEVDIGSLPPRKPIAETRPATLARVGRARSCGEAGGAQPHVAGTRR
jgi:hypothetical protein